MLSTKMRMRQFLNLVRPLVLTGIIFLQVAVAAASRGGSESSCGCSLVDKNIPTPSYLSLVKLSSDRKIVILRLVNNTDCLVEVEARGGGMIALPANGPEILGHAAREQDGEMMAVDYYLQDADFSKRPRLYYDRGDTIYIAFIKPGLSVTFSVPMSAFRKNNIMVPVKIKVGEITFRPEAYFFASDLSIR